MRRYDKEKRSAFAERLLLFTVSRNSGGNRYGVQPSIH